MEADSNPHLPLQIYLAGPRGFCAGVDRAIMIVERAIEKFGPPVYVRHEIVHNRTVVEDLEAKGAIFVDEIDQAPQDRPIIFSAHGVPKSVPAAAQDRQMLYVDATCPLVSKVHREVERHHEQGRTIILIGHQGHPEVIGTMGQLPAGAIFLVETLDDIAKLVIPADQPLAYATQTTLSLDETSSIIAALKAHFPHIEGPKKEDICYATTNRQQAVRTIAGMVDILLVLGAPNSSNSRRLVDVAQAAGCHNAYLIQSADEINWAWFDGCRNLGLTAGASAPEKLVDGVIAACKQHFDVTVSPITTAEEHISFKLPRLLSNEPSL